MLNMFVGVVVENFHRCREEQEKEEKARRAAKRAKKLEKKRRSKSKSDVLYYMETAIALSNERRVILYVVFFLCMHLCVYLSVSIKSIVVQGEVAQ